MDRAEIAGILGAAGLRPRKQFGQNFMIDQAALRAIVDAAELDPRDIVLEVGPGVGNLTRMLARASRHVLAVDIDRKLLPAARRHHAALTNVTWMLADVLAGKHQVEPAVLDALRRLGAPDPSTSHFKLVSNLPYNVASPLVAELLVEMWRRLVRADSACPWLSRMTFTVQWEVAQRMIAKPGTRDYGPLGVIIQSLADVGIVRKIAAGAFWPPPKIQSALVVVIPQPDRMREVRDAIALQQFLSGVFGHRRQTLVNGLRHFHGDAWRPEWKQNFAEAGFDLSQRAESLSLEQLLQLEGLNYALSRPAPHSP